MTLLDEYVCLTQDELTHPLKVFAGGKEPGQFLEVSDTHLFLGYKPLLIGIPFPVNAPQVAGLKNEICMSFSERSESCTSGSGWNVAKEKLASIQLFYFGQKYLGNSVVLLYEGKFATHQFLSWPHQKLNSIRLSLARQRTGNIDLTGNLYDQVRIAYAVPRTISIISLGQGNEFNMFPTDLHGPIGKECYAGSLRIGGKANQQVENHGNLVIAEVDSSWFKEAYALGKNHMKELQPKENFLIHGWSEKFQLPLPPATLSYRELQWKESVDRGVHRIHFYEILNRKKITQGHSLSHIHQYYAQWRLDHNLETRILSR